MAATVTSIEKSAANQPSVGCKAALYGCQIEPGADGTYVIHVGHVGDGIVGFKVGFSNSADMLKWLTAGHLEADKGRADGWF